MKFHKNAWINQLVREYKKIPVDKIDAANDKILKCLLLLQQMNGFFDRDGR